MAKEVFFLRVSREAKNYIMKKAKTKGVHANDEVDRLILQDKKKIEALRSKRAKTATTSQAS